MGLIYNCDKEVKKKFSLDNQFNKSIQEADKSYSKLIK